MRSKLGGHFAGHGMSYPAGYNSDEARDIKISSYRYGCRMETDKFKSNKEGKKAFEDYCKEQSGAVLTYNIRDLKKK